MEPTKNLGGLGKIWGACAPWPQPKTATVVVPLLKTGTYNLTFGKFNIARAQRINAYA